jgi:hypothetical protein
MRTLAVAAITSLIALALATTASAAPTVSMVWEGSGGSDTIAANVGDTITVLINVTPDANGVSAGGISIDYSVGGSVSTNYVAGLEAINDGTGASFFPSASASYGSGSLAFLSGTACPTGGDSIGNLIPGRCGDDIQSSIGSVADLGGIVSTFAHSGVGGAISGAYTIGSATFVVVPEPATGGLLALGLGALALIGRRR